MPAKGRGRDAAAAKPRELKVLAHNIWFGRSVVPGGLPGHLPRRGSSRALTRQSVRTGTLAWSGGLGGQSGSPGGEGRAGEHAAAGEAGGHGVAPGGGGLVVLPTLGGRRERGLNTSGAPRD